MMQVSEQKTIGQQQFKELFLSEYGRMYKAAYILLGDEDDAKDAVQDVFAKLWDGTTQLREESTRTFLLTCVRNRCLNISARRRSMEHRVKSVELATAMPSMDGAAAVNSTVYSLHSPLNDDDELIEAVKQYVDERLTPQTGRIIKMHFNEEQSYKEISSELGISVSAVNKHIVQGLRKLRDYFKN